MNIHVLFLKLLLIICYVIPPASASQVLELKYVPLLPKPGTILKY